MGRRCVRHVQQQWPGAAKIQVRVVEGKPVCGYPIIGWGTAKDGAGLEANYRFTAAPIAIGARSVPGGNERVLSIAGNATNSPYFRPWRRRWPMPLH